MTEIEELKKMNTSLLQLQFPNSRITTTKHKGKLPEAPKYLLPGGTRRALPKSVQPRVILTGCSANVPDRPPQELHPIFAVVDNFLTDTVDTDGDGIDDKTHGEVIETIIKKQCPGAVVKKQGLLPYGNGGFSYSDLIANIEGVKKASELGTQFYGVNISSEASSSFEQASKLLKEEVTAGNLADKRSQLQEKLTEDQQRLVQALEALTERGIPVYIAAGNNGRDKFNIMSLADKINTVKATNAKGNIEDYSADNSLATKEAQGTYNTVAVKNKDGKILGFNLTGGDEVQIPVNGTPPKSQCEEKFKLIEILDIKIDKDDEHFKSSKNLLDYISKKYQDLGCKNKNKRCHILSDINQYILGFDSFELMVKVQNAILKEQEPGTDLTNKTFINKYIDRLEDMETLRYVKFGKEGEPFFDFDGSGRNAFGVIAGTSFAAPAAMVRDYLDQQQKAKSNNLAEKLSNGFPPEKVFEVIE